MEPRFDILATVQDSHDVAVRNAQDLVLKVACQPENRFFERLQPKRWHWKIRVDKKCITGDQITTMKEFQAKPCRVCLAAPRLWDVGTRACQSRGPIEYSNLGSCPLVRLLVSPALRLADLPRTFPRADLFPRVRVRSMNVEQRSPLL